MSQSKQKQIKEKNKKNYEIYLASLPPQYWREVLAKPIKKRECNSNILRYISRMY